MKALAKRLEIGLEELILAFLILIELLDFFTIIPPALEYVEKVVAIIAMCYLFYKASVTKITFGVREKNYDVLIVFAFILLSFKTVIGFLISAVREESIMQGFYNLVLSNAALIEKTSFWLGGVLLLVIAGALVHEKVKKPCILSIIHEGKKAAGVRHSVVRFLSIYLVLISVFVVVFMLAIEWLAITVDAPVMMIVLFFYLFVIVKRGRRMDTESFLFRVSESSEGFYSRFISLFHSRKTITTAITGLLVLHLLVEIGAFVIPYTTGLMYPAYFEQLGAGHAPLGPLMANDFAMAGSALLQMGVLIVYSLNVLAVLMLFFGPAYAWSCLYRKKRIALTNIFWLFFGGMTVFVLLPVFKIGQVKSAMLLGADITTQQIPVLQNVLLVLITALVVMAIFYILGLRSIRQTTKLAFLVVFVYFGIYLYHFFISLAKYYIKAVTLLAQGKQYFIAAHMLIFFTITILLYIGGYIMFLHEAYLKQKI
jgi:hypothetical protein